MKLSFFSKYETKTKDFCPVCSVAQYRAEILTTFGSYFGRNDGFINS
jgi:hypothetical protein